MKLQIISYNPCKNPRPMPAAEVEQRLTITGDGRIWFSSRNFQQHVRNRGTCWYGQAYIGRWKAEHILSCFAGYLIKDYQRTKDSLGDWHAVITDDRGRKVHADGILAGGVTYRRADLSKLIRRLVPVRSLWVFDSEMSDDYDGRSAICSFAADWRRAYERKDPVICDMSVDFGNRCLELGFNMDEGEEFRRRYPEAAWTEDGSAGAWSFDRVADLDVLGSGVFSTWFQIIRDSGDKLLEEECRAWFLGALSRMEKLAAARQG